MAISYANYDIQYLPPDLPKLHKQASRSKITVGHEITARIWPSLKLCTTDVLFVSSGTWPRNLPMLAGYDLMINFCGGYR